MPEVDPAGHLRQLRDRVGALAPVPTALHGKLLRQSSVPASLATTPFVFVHRDGKKKPLQTKGSNKQGCPRSTDNFSFRASESDAPIAANIQGSEERVRGNWLRDSRPLHLDRGGRPNTDFWMRRTVSQRREWCNGHRFIHLFILSSWQQRSCYFLCLSFSGSRNTTTKASPTVVGKVWLSRRLFIELPPLSN